MKRVLIFSTLFVTLICCTKDKFQTKPQIKLKTDGNIIVPQNGTLAVLLEYTDKEGDVDDSLFVRKVRKNRRVVATVRDTFSLKIPNFPNTPKGEITAFLYYQGNLISAAIPPSVPGANPPRVEADTLDIKFVLKDKAGNKSDTAVLTNVIIQRN